MQPLLRRGLSLAPAAPRPRHFGSSKRFVKEREFRKRAVEQHIDYFRQLEGPRTQRRVDVDPKLLRPWDETRQVFGYPSLMEQMPTGDTQMKGPRISVTPRYEGQLRSWGSDIDELRPFGELKVSHGDIFEAQADALILPMSANLCPYRGLALEALDRGGAELVKRVFNEAKHMWETAKASGEGSRGSPKDDEALWSGDVVAVDDPNVDRRLFFVIMPYFWQGSAMDASKRLRHCIRRALSEVCVQAKGPVRVAMPNLGGGVFGYEPKHGCSLHVEEAFEALLQIEKEVPRYNFKSIELIDSRYETAKQLEDAMIEVVQGWLPRERLTTAPQFYNRATQRLLVLPAGAGFYWKRHPIKFKRNHSVVRKAKQDYKGNMYPRLWRPQMVHMPPPLLVHRQPVAPGEARIADQDRQYKPRQYFLRGVSHWLFPSRRSGYHRLRKSASGRWVADPRRFRITSLVKPRL